MPTSNLARSRRAARWATGLAAGAVLAGHGLTYLIVQPDPHERAGLLATTGHAYLHLLEVPGLVAVVASTVAAALIGLGRLGEMPGSGAVFRRLATVQLAAFLAMEISERSASGAPIATPRDLTLLTVGSGIQLVLAHVGAHLFTVVGRSGQRLKALVISRSSDPPRPSLPRRMPVAAVPSSAAMFGVARGRGPPAFLP